MTTNTQTRDMTIEEFCDLHDACEEGREWALENCDSMQDAWQKLEPEWLLWVATRDGVLTDKELRLSACWCARQVWHLLDDERSKKAIEVAERFANGEATEEELEAADLSARSARWEVDSASSPASWAASSSASWAASWAADSSARSARWAADLAASWAASSAASSAVRSAQAAYLRENCKPNFRRVEG